MHNRPLWWYVCFSFHFSPCLAVFRFLAVKVESEMSAIVNVYVVTKKWIQNTKKAILQGLSITLQDGRYITFYSGVID
ncbi:hypothetical protein PHOSAC3_70006 [Mesotoga infera]|nr:hypothetical protein PHOSAC3_70006 [Mesotoga infera]